MQSIFSKIFNIPKPQKDITTEADIKTVPITQMNIEENTDEEEKLIAIITAAIAASLNTSTYNLRITSIKRTSNTFPAWNSIGNIR